MNQNSENDHKRSYEDEINDVQLKQADNKKNAQCFQMTCKWQKLQMENVLAQNTHNIEREEIMKQSAW